MKLNEHERARPNIAGLISPVQQTEMKLLLSGRWPPLKPLPVFKYETDEYRASIDFDKTRGEWVCRKTSLPSNKVQELRGGLAEITMALPRGQAEVFAECGAGEQPEQELEKDASRRLQAILEWKENYENGAFYSGLQDYLSESQHEEIADSIRLTLTARQLQFNSRNVAFVFDALLKAGGKLETLIEIAQRNKTEQGEDVPAKAEAAAPDAELHMPVGTMQPERDRRLRTRITPASRAYVDLGGAKGGIVLNISEMGMAVAVADPLVVDDYLPRIRFQLPSSGQSVEISAQIVWRAESRKSAGIRFVDLTADARNQISNWIASEEPASEFGGLTAGRVEKPIPATPESLPEEPMASVFPEKSQPSSRELIAHGALQACEIVMPEIPERNPQSLVEDVQEEVQRHAQVAGSGRQARTFKIESLANRFENSPSLVYVLKISAFQVAAVVLLFAVISLTVGLTVGRGSLGKRLRETQKSIPNVDATSPAPLDHPGETTSRTSPPAAANTFRKPAANPPEAAAGSPSESPSAQSLHARPEHSATRLGPIGTSPRIPTRSLTDSGDAEAGPERQGSSKLMARNAPPLANSQPAHSPGAAAPTSGAPADSAPRNVKLVARSAAHPLSPLTLLVTGPGDGRKPFRLTLPEKTIAASSSFAMTSQLSVLVSPEPGPTPANMPARLQAPELVSFGWPRYPRPGDRHGSSETAKVRITIGELGQVVDVKPVSGSTSLLPAAMSAIRLWRYKPTLLNSRPVQAQQDVTIEFRPQQRLSPVPTRRPSRH